MTNTSSVIREKRGQAFWITINRPDKRNAINADVVAGIARGYRDAHDDREVRVIVLTGATRGLGRALVPAFAAAGHEEAQLRCGRWMSGTHVRYLRIIRN